MRHQRRRRADNGHSRDYGLTLTSGFDPELAFRCARRDATVARQFEVPPQEPLEASLPQNGLVLPGQVSPVGNASSNQKRLPIAIGRLWSKFSGASLSAASVMPRISSETRPLKAAARATPLPSQATQAATRRAASRARFVFTGSPSGSVRTQMDDALNRLWPGLAWPPTTCGTCPAGFRGCPTQGRARTIGRDRII